MRNFGPTNPHGTAFAPKQCLYQKESTGMESPKMYCPSRCRYHTYHCVATNYPVSWRVYSPEWKYAKLRPYQSPWYRVCTKAMVISKGSYQSNVYIKRKLRAWRVQKCIALVGSYTVITTSWKQSTPFQYRAQNGICENLAIPIPMVPRLHQSNGYIKRKLRAWSVQKCNALVRVDTVLTTAWKQTTPFHGG